MLKMTPEKARIFINLYRLYVDRIKSFDTPMEMRKEVLRITFLRELRGE